MFIIYLHIYIYTFLHICWLQCWHTVFELFRCCQKERERERETALANIARPTKTTLTCEALGVVVVVKPLHQENPNVKFFPGSSSSDSEDGSWTEQLQVEFTLQNLAKRGRKASGTEWWNGETLIVLNDKLGNRMQQTNVPKPCFQVCMQSKCLQPIYERSRDLSSCWRSCADSRHQPRCVGLLPPIAINIYLMMIYCHLSMITSNPCYCFFLIFQHVIYVIILVCIANSNWGITLQEDYVFLVESDGENPSTDKVDVVSSRPQLPLIVSTMCPGRRWKWGMFSLFCVCVFSYGSIDFYCIVYGCLWCLWGCCRVLV